MMVATYLLQVTMDVECSTENSIFHVRTEVTMVEYMALIEVMCKLLLEVIWDIEVSYSLLTADILQKLLHQIMNMIE